MQTRKLRNRLRRTRSKYSRNGKTLNVRLTNRQSSITAPQWDSKRGGALIETPKVVYGRIHANWCGHCQHLHKLWPSVVREINNLTKKGEYKAVSIEQNEEGKKLPWVNKHFVKAGAELAVQGGYPTLYKIVNGRVHYYNGERDPKAIAKFVTSA